MLQETPEYIQLKEALADIGGFIKNGRQKLVNQYPDDIVERYIPDSNSELKAVITATEEASNTIMDSCDKISAIAEGLDEETKEKLLAETSVIFSSCGFQDITSQRIAKVTSYLSHVEKKTLVLIKSLKNFFDQDGSLSEELSQRKEEKIKEENHRDEDDDFMNGPSLEGDGLSQADVDALLDDF